MGQWQALVSRQGCEVFVRLMRITFKQKETWKQSIISIFEEKSKYCLYLIFSKHIAYEFIINWRMKDLLVVPQYHTTAGRRHSKSLVSFGLEANTQAPARSTWSLQAFLDESQGLQAMNCDFTVWEQANQVWHECLCGSSRFDQVILSEILERIDGFWTGYTAGASPAKAGERFDPFKWQLKIARWLKNQRAGSDLVNMKYFKRMCHNGLRLGEFGQSSCRSTSLTPGSLFASHREWKLWELSSVIKPGPPSSTMVAPTLA